jgi:hypothetical protein
LAIVGSNCSSTFLERKRITKTKDSLAEQGEFELPVPISEQPDDNMMSGSGTRRSVGIARGLKRLVGLYSQQHSKETFPSGAMDDIATDVAAAIK